MVRVTTAGINAGSKVISNVASGGTTTTNAANIGDVKAAAAAATTIVTAGDNIVVTPTTNADGSKTYQVATAKTVAFDKVTVGDPAGTVITVDGTTKTITGLANTTLSTADFAKVGRAATEEQLNLAQTNVSNILGGNATNTAGNITMTDIGGTGTNTVHDAIQAVNTQANSPLTFADDSGTKVERKLGETVNVKGGNTGTLTNGNIGVVANGTDTLEVKLAEAVNLGSNGSVTIGNTVVNNAGLMINGGPSVTASGIHAGNKQITNVASGGNIIDAAYANNAANIGDVKAAAAAAKTTVSAGSYVVVTKTTDATTGADNYQVATAKQMLILTK